MRSLIRLLLILLPLTTQAASLEKLWKISRSEHYTPPSVQELAQAEALFRRSLAGENDASLTAAWAELGFSLETMTDRGRSFTVLREQAERQQGRGFFVFARDQVNSRLFLQTPHSFKDLQTGKIGLRLFREGGFAAAAWNTVPRHYVVDGTRVDADMAHHAASYLRPFSRALVRQQPQALVIQIHGFSNDKRQSAASTAGFVVSAGSKNPSQQAHQLSACLTSQFGQPALLFPRDVNELGGTQNLVGQTLREQGSNGFIHLEMALAIRQQLRKDAALRQKLLTCLTP